MERIKVILNVQKKKSSDFNKYLNEMVGGLRHNAQVDKIVWLEKQVLLIALSVVDRDEKWGVLSELLKWIYCEQYGDVFDLISIVCV